ncbi:hypothetical protein [Pseudanabaena sp. BC1403]|uniref:hypothetical protein n=1 Tax=Pseudanabaena sp. BC1403 TaxID=2043171 RepID=UPI000CD9072A|nr:hypothetical protein [Pseudanabaena sp. BC1403]
MTSQTEEVEGACPCCRSIDISEFHEPFRDISRQTCKNCGSEWEEETTSWAQEEAKELSDEQIAELGTERDPKMIPCGCSENISKYDCNRFGCLRETL